MKKTPTGIKIIVILNYILAVLLLILGLTCVLGALDPSNFVQKIPIESVKIALIQSCASTESTESYISSMNSESACILLSTIPIVSFLESVLFAVVAVIFLALAVFSFFIGKELLKAKRWARIAEIICAVAGAIFSLILLARGDLTNLLWGIIWVVIGSYLLFSKKVKKTFN